MFPEQKQTTPAGSVALHLGGLYMEAAGSQQASCVQRDSCIA